MIAWVKKIVFQKYFAAFLRWLTTAGAAALTVWLASKSGLPQDQVASVVNPLIADIVAALALLVPLLLSFIDKAKNQPTLPQGTKAQEIVVVPKDVAPVKPVITELPPARR